MTISQMAQINNSSTLGYAATSSAKIQGEISSFQKMLDNMTNVSSSQVLSSSRLNGEYTSDYSSVTTSSSDKNSLPRGFAANSATASSEKGTIDRTSKLYEKSLELEGYFVKMMLSSMRNTVQKSGLSGKESYASKMYEDMMYDELSVSMTKNAGFGLADKIYLSLAAYK